MNPVIAVTGEMAVARSYYLVMVEGERGPVPSVRGTYDDVLIRAPGGSTEGSTGGWRFPRRELTHAFKGEKRLTLPVTGNSG